MKEKFFWPPIIFLRKCLGKRAAGGQLYFGRGIMLKNQHGKKNDDN